MGGALWREVLSRARQRTKPSVVDEATYCRGSNASTGVYFTMEEHLDLALRLHSPGDVSDCLPMRARPPLLGKTLDLSKAYRQVAVHPESRRHAVLGFPDARDPGSTTFRSPCRLELLQASLALTKLP